MDRPVCSHSSASSPAASACRRSPRRCRHARASPSRRCRCCWRALHEELGRALSSARCPTTPTPATRRGRRLVPRRGTRRALPEPRRPLGFGARASAAPRRRAGARARRPRWRGLVCASAAALAEGCRRLSSAPAPIRLEAGRRAGLRAAGRAARARRLRARRARRGARPVRRPRRPHRRLPDHRSRAAADRALRRRDRGHPRVLAVHAARAHPVDDAQPSTPRPSGGST